MEAIVLAGGMAERMGDAAAGRPKSLVEVGGRPLLAWQIGRLRRAGVERVIVSCAAGQEPEFERTLAVDGLPTPPPYRFGPNVASVPVPTLGAFVTRDTPNSAANASSVGIGPSGGQTPARMRCCSTE